MKLLITLITLFTLISASMAAATPWSFNPVCPLGTGWQIPTPHSCEMSGVTKAITVDVCNTHCYLNSTKAECRKFNGCTGSELEKYCHAETCHEPPSERDMLDSFSDSAAAKGCYFCETTIWWSVPKPHDCEKDGDSEPITSWICAENCHFDEKDIHCSSWNGCKGATIRKYCDTVCCHPDEGSNMRAASFPIVMAPSKRDLPSLNGHPDHCEDTVGMTYWGLREEKFCAIDQSMIHALTPDICADRCSFDGKAVHCHGQFYGCSARTLEGFCEAACGRRNEAAVHMAVATAPPTPTKIDAIDNQRESAKQALRVNWAVPTPHPCEKNGVTKMITPEICAKRCKVDLAWIACDAFNGCKGGTLSKYCKPE